MSQHHTHDRRGRPSQSIDAPRHGDDPDTPDSVAEERQKPDDDIENPSDTPATRNQSNVSPDDYPKDDGGRPDYGSPKRKDKDDPSHKG